MTRLRTLHKRWLNDPTYRKAQEELAREAQGSAPPASPPSARIGSHLDDFLKAEGIFEEAEAQARAEVAQKQD